jgi:hypothetical protein
MLDDGIVPKKGARTKNREEKEKRQRKRRKNMKNSFLV